MTQTLKLDRKLDFRGIAPLVRSLEAARGADVILDASDLVQISTQAVQVLVSASLSWDQDRHALQLCNLAPQVSDQIALLGLRVDAGRLVGAPA